MQTFSFQAPEELGVQLADCAKKLDRSKGYIIRAALEAYLEDMEDLLEAKRIQASYQHDELVDFNDLKRELNLPQ